MKHRKQRQKQKKTYLWSSLYASLSSQVCCPATSSLFGLSRFSDSPPQFRESSRLYLSYLSLCQGLDCLPKQESGAIIVTALFISRLAEKTAFHCLISSVLKTTFSYNLFSFLFVSGDRVNPVSVITPWPELGVNSMTF